MSVFVFLNLRSLKIKFLSFSIRFAFDSLGLVSSLVKKIAYAVNVAAIEMVSVSPDRSIASNRDTVAAINDVYEMTLVSVISCSAVSNIFCFIGEVYVVVMECQPIEIDSPCIRGMFFSVL